MEGGFKLGVDYYSCKNCEETFPDCGHYGHCSKCETMFCGNCYDKFVKTYGEIDKSHARYSWYGVSLPECDHCNGKKVNDSDLLKFALGKLKVTKTALKKEYVKIKFK